MSLPKLLTLSLAEAGEAVASGRVSSVELTRAALEALERYGGPLNAVAALDGDRALDEARRRDEERSRGAVRGPLHGVPMAHKDMFYRRGRECASGSRIRRGFVPEVTATVLERLDAAGAVDLGRLNMVEFALGVTGHNAITGHPRNPWHRDHITGGSSSGPVATVAARLNFASLGSDTGGSIRVPATCTGLVGLKPTYGRVSRYGCLPLSHSLDHIGPLTRTARDTALILDAIAGHDPRDATTSTRPAGGLAAKLERDLTGLRVAVAEPPFEVGMAPEVQTSLESGIAALRGLGLTVRARPLPAFKGMNELRRAVLVAEVAARHRPWIARQPEAYNPQTRARMAGGFAIDAVTYLRALTQRSASLKAFVEEVFAEADLLVLPAIPHPVPRIAETDLGASPGFARVVNELGHFIFPFNYLGLPAMAVPVAPTPDGLPMAMQIVARPFAEATLLAVAHQLDRATGYSLRRPPYPETAPD